MKVTVVCVTPERESKVELDLDPGTTVAEAVLRSGVLTQQRSGQPMPTIGVWNRVVPADHPLKDGDRVEIYRALIIDPKEARRLRAGLTKKRPRR